MPSQPTIKRFFVAYRREKRFAIDCMSLSALSGLESQFSIVQAIFSSSAQMGWLLT